MAVGTRVTEPGVRVVGVRKAVRKLVVDSVGVQGDDEARDEQSCLRRGRRRRDRLGVSWK